MKLVKILIRNDIIKEFQKIAQRFQGINNYDHFKN